MTKFTGPNSVTTSVSGKTKNDRPAWYELVSQRISRLVEGLASLGPTFHLMKMERLTDDFQLFMAELPAEVAHELARRYVDVPNTFRNFRYNRSIASKFADEIQAVLDDLANRKDE